MVSVYLEKSFYGERYYLGSILLMIKLMVIRNVYSGMLEEKQ